MSEHRIIWTFDDGGGAIPEDPQNTVVTVAEIDERLLEIAFRMDVYRDSVSLHSGYIERDRIRALRDALSAWLGDE